MAEAFQAFDLYLFSLLTPFDRPWLDTLMSWISASGAASTIWLVIAGAALTRRQHWAAVWRLLLIVGLSYLVVDAVVKPLVARPRPSVVATDPPRALPPMPRSYSFPSGHAASTFGASIAMSRMLPQARVWWWTLALLIGYSRIYLGHHYPLDVAGGAGVGILVALWVLGGRHPATYSRTRQHPLPAGVVVRP